MKKVFVALFVVIALAAAAGVGWSLLREPGPPPGDRPNILLVSIDTLRADHVGCYGYGVPTTPHLDALAAEGVRFDRTLSNSPWTLPSHVTMLTGQEVGVHNVRFSKSVLADSATTIAELLQDAGYDTIGFGSAPYLKARYGFAQGFDVYDDELAHVSYKESHDAVTSKKVVSKALHQIDKRRDKNWFMFMHMWDVHYDYIPPAPFDKKFVDPDYTGRFRMHNWEKNKKFRVGMDDADFAYVISQYDGEIAWVDDQLGRLIAQLKEWGLYERTVIIITADHGEEFLDHGQKGHGHSLFDELIRVPLIVKGPQTPAGKVVECPVGLVDLFPSIAAWAKLPHVRYKGPGRNLLDLIFDRQACDAERGLFAETKMSNLDKLHAYKRGYEMMLERDRFKFHHRLTDPVRELLFNVGEDPLERNDLLKEQPELHTDMQEQMKQHSRTNGKLRTKRRMAGRSKLDAKTERQLKELGYIQ